MIINPRNFGYLPIRNPEDPDTSAGERPPNAQTSWPFVYDLNMQVDTRGALFECWRESWENGLDNQGVRQAYISITHPDTVKGWHLHPKNQIDRFVLVRGRVIVALCDLSDFDGDGANLPEVREVCLDANLKPQVLIIPPGTAHGWYCPPGNGDAWVLNLVSHEYDGTDEFRRPANAGPIDGRPYDWRKSRDS